MSDQPPFYNHLGHPVDPSAMTDKQRAVLEASETILGVEIAFGSDIPGEIGAMLADLTRRGWWTEIKSPFQPGTPNGDLYWAGLTPLGTSGWNGRPDHQVGDVSLRGALWRAMLLAFMAEKEAALP